MAKAHRKSNEVILQEADGLKLIRKIKIKYTRSRFFLNMRIHQLQNMVPTSKLDGDRGKLRDKYLDGLAKLYNQGKNTDLI